MSYQCAYRLSSQKAEIYENDTHDSINDFFSCWRVKLSVNGLNFQRQFGS